MLNRVNQILGSIPKSSKNNHVTNFGQANSGMVKKLSLQSLPDNKEY